MHLADIALFHEAVYVDNSILTARFDLRYYDTVMDAIDYMADKAYVLQRYPNIFTCKEILRENSKFLKIVNKVARKKPDDIEEIQNMANLSLLANLTHRLHHELKKRTVEVSEEIFRQYEHLGQYKVDSRPRYGKPIRISDADEHLLVAALTCKKNAAIVTCDTDFQLMLDKIDHHITLYTDYEQTGIFMTETVLRDNPN